MAKFTVVIKNRFADEHTVARIRTFTGDKTDAEFMVFKLNNSWIDNDIYFADIDEEGTDEEIN